ncbi:unnamed protein product [Acanthoscelides obtectus]|uniref:Uncharacterized protein n=1 Tax=Acanthoscelides obtectus TaxID=200917 RepID=A0A9P0K884_ACAOB|nr:unnamed protein product [Acanthoscelides obtectus]CAK1622915.1 hypothetical protein AOBTE_LOCUS1727 [Acanthoscelides obtectus]
MNRFLSTFMENLSLRKEIHRLDSPEKKYWKSKIM